MEFGRSGRICPLDFWVYARRDAISPPSGRSSTCQHWLPRLDSHQDQRGQSPTCCCYTTRQGLVEPEVVATSPCRIKSPMPVCCGFDSMKWWAREDLHLQG